MVGLLLFLLTCVQQSFSQDMTAVFSSCTGLKDGTYMMKLLEGDYPVLQVKCSNEHMLIDYSQEPEWQQYFSSWEKYHYAVAGPAKTDHSNWKNWFLPSADQDNYFFTVSSSCDECISVDETSEKTAYYMSGSAFGCYEETSKWSMCNMDFDTYECKVCEWNSDHTKIIVSPRTQTSRDQLKDSQYAGMCDFEVLSPKLAVLQTFQDCQKETSLSYKPSLGLDGRKCVCAKAESSSTLDVSVSEITSKESALEAETEEEEEMEEEEKEEEEGELTEEAALKKMESHYVYLSQSDFEAGTYRITEPGTYVLKENIELDFNGLSEDPLSDSAWRPSSEELYPGSVSGQGPYSMGFFAGITVECDCVMIDLNNYGIGMSKEFFYAQPFFSIIELGSQPFLPGEGTSFFGSDPKFPAHVIIKNGKLGLTSHHAVHGYNNHHVLLSGLQITDFLTHGIQINGFSNLIIEKSDIGPTFSHAKLNGNFAQMKLILPTLHKIAEKYPDETITFGGQDKAYTMSELVTTLESVMLKAWAYAIDDTVFLTDMISSVTDDSNSKDDAIEWNLVVELFDNESHFPYGGSVFGILLNGFSSAIYSGNSFDADENKELLISDVKVRGLRHKGQEVLGLVDNSNERLFVNALGAPMSMKSLFLSGVADPQIDDSNYWALLDNNYGSKYVQYDGDLISKIWMAMYKFASDDFEMWSSVPYMGENQELLDWAQDEDSEYIPSDFLLGESDMELRPSCNADVMHGSAKGLVGIKISGVTSVQLKDVDVFDFADSTSLGSTVCQYFDSQDYGFFQQSVFDSGFTMNNVYGIAVDSVKNMDVSDLELNDLVSETGLTIGMAFWNSEHLTLTDSVVVKNIEAGSSSEAVQGLTYEDLPNAAPEVCAIKISSSTDVQFGDDTTEDDISISCVTGSVGCFGEANIYSSVGKLDTDTTACYTSNAGKGEDFTNDVYDLIAETAEVARRLEVMTTHTDSSTLLHTVVSQIEKRRVLGYDKRLTQEEKDAKEAEEERMRTIEDNVKILKNSKSNPNIASAVRVNSISFYIVVGLLSLSFLACICRTYRMGRSDGYKEYLAIKNSYENNDFEYSSTKFW